MVLEHIVLLVIVHLLEVIVILLKFIFFIENTFAEEIVGVCSGSLDPLVGIRTLRIMRHDRILGSMIDHADWMMVIL